MVADMGEELYGKINDLREQTLELRETVAETNRRMGAVENKLDDQAAILEALAEKQGIDVDELLTQTAIEEAESADLADGNDAGASEPIPDADGDGNGSE